MKVIDLCPDFFENTCQMRLFFIIHYSLFFNDRGVLHNTSSGIARVYVIY